MEINAWTIYLWQLADNVSRGALIVALLCAIASIGCFLALLAVNDEETRKNSNGDDLCAFLFKKSKLFGYLAICLIPVVCLLPSSNTIAMMVVVPKIAQSKLMQRDMPDLYNAAVEALKEQLKKKED